jgi:hypothetical protein
VGVQLSHRSQPRRADEWPKWSPAARSFIEADEGNIAIEDVASNYVSLVVGFHAWFKEALQDRQAHALAELERERQRVRRALARSCGNP